MYSTAAQQHSWPWCAMGSHRVKQLSPTILCPSQAVVHPDASGKMPLHVALQRGGCEVVVQLLCVPEVSAFRLIVHAPIARKIVCHGMLIRAAGTMTAVHIHT